MNSVEFKPLELSSVEDLKRVLNNYPNINTGNWIKSVQALFNEVESKDCVLGIENGKLHRRVDVVCVKCFHTNDQGERLQLFEQKQIFKNGHIRERGNTYVAEKLQLGELPKDGALRGVAEELQILGPHVRITALSKENKFEKKESSTYKGIECSYNTYVFACEISKQDYKESYVEDQEDKQTFFSWLKI